MGAISPTGYSTDRTELADHGTPKPHDGMMSHNMRLVGHAAYDKDTLQSMLQKLRQYADALIVYFNSGCDGCQTAMETWTKEGLLSCANVFFVEFNASTQGLLTHVTHIPSYERCHNGATTWSTGFPVDMRTVTKTSHPVLICRPET